jgi:hypothetical protein
MSLHHPNNCLENIFIFYLPLLNSVAKKYSQVKKNIGGAFAPLPPPQDTPTAALLMMFKLALLSRTKLETFYLIYQFLDRPVLYISYVGN